VLDRAACRRRLEWFDAFRDGIFCAAVADDQTLFTSLMRWPNADLPNDEGAWDVPATYNAWYILLGLWFRAEDTALQSEIAARIRASKHALPRSGLAALHAVDQRDGQAVAAALGQLAQHNRKHEFRADHPMRAVTVDGAVIAYLAEIRGTRLPTLPEDVLDRLPVVKS
jgi:hypothetical protein